MKLAAIDVGSNSIHLMICRTLPDHSYEVIYKDKAMVRLGSRVFANGVLSESSRKRGLVVMERFSQVIRRFDVDAVVGVATSAVREAKNGNAFLREVRRLTGLKIDRISGAEEARLVAVAVGAVAPFDQGRRLVIDIGGGSTELACLENQEPYYTQSMKMGAVRLTEEVGLGDRPGKKGIKALKSAAQDRLGPLLRRLKGQTFDSVAGTSGSIVCLGMLAARRAGLALPRGQTFSITRAQLKGELQYLASLDLSERGDYMGDQSPRADIIVAGGAILLAVLDGVANDEIHVPDCSIRDGMIVDYIRQKLEATPGDHIVRLARMARTETDDPYDPHAVRERNIISLARRYHYDAEHAHRVMRLAGQLFDGTADLHGLGAEEKFYLEAAAILHDIGQYIAYSAHHRHSLYLILNGGLAGFSDREIQIIGNVARYHRKGGPRGSHEEFMQLAPEDRRTVRSLAALLRIADGLDYGHLGSVDRLRVERGNKAVTFNLTCNQECAAEMKRAGRKADYFAKVFGLGAKFTSRKSRRPRAAEHEVA